MSAEPTYRQLLADTLENVSADGAVLCLCAAWCGVCRDFRTLFDEAERQHPGLRFRWIDVEDEADLLGDLDVETFPTLVVGSGERLVFGGPVLPQPGQLQRYLRLLER